MAIIGTVVAYALTACIFVAGIVSFGAVSVGILRGYDK